MEANLQNSVRELLSGLDGFVSSKSVVGEPISVGDTTIVPLMDLQIGVGAGSYNGKANGAAGGLGASMKPTALIILKEGDVRLVRVSGEQSGLVQVLDAIPEVVDRVKQIFVKLDPEVEEAIKTLEAEAKEKEA